MLLARRKEDEMKYTPLQPDEIREQVYQEAKNQFLAHGIASTEMKKLAEAVGIGRTTLYRYFPSLDRLVFMTATELWDSIFEDLMGEGYPLILIKPGFLRRNITVGTHRKDYQGVKIISFILCKTAKLFIPIGK